MKRTLCLFLSLIMALSILSSVPISANAASADYLTFELNEDGESYSVTGCVFFADGELVIPNTFNGLPVTCIADNAFEWCQDVESIKTGDSVTKIGNHSFSNCTSLESVVVGNSVSTIGDYAFEWCENLKSVTLGKSVQTIGEFAFQECSNLTSINIPKSIKNIGYTAFGWCESLASVQLPETIAEIQEGAFRCSGLKSIVIPEGVNRIGDSAFESCDYLTLVTLPESLKSIGRYAFNYCNFSNISIPNGVEKIGEYAFSCCYSLTEIEIPETVTKIEKSAFDHCGNLTKVSFGSAVTSIGHGSFAFCRKLSDISIPDSVVNIDASAFYTCNINSVEIPETVGIIGEKAFGYYLDTSTYQVAKKNDFIIYGVKKTVAEVYANENEFKFIDLSHTHTSSSWITDTKATVYKAGSKHKECTVCKETLETAKIAQLKPGRTTVKATTTSTGIKITWSKVTGADKYTVYRKTGDGSYKALKTVTGTSYTDTTAKSGTKYKYNVKAKNEAGYGEYAKSGVTKLFLATPKVTVSNASTGVTVKWNKITGAKGYYVYRKASGAKSWTKIATVKSGSTVSYTDKKATAGKKYYYTVKAYNGDYVSTTKASSIIEFLKAPTIKSVTSGKSGVTVKWAKATGADGYYVYRKTGSGSYSKIATVKGNTKVSYLDKSAKKGKTYTYYVKAYSGKSVSTSSKTLKIKDKY